MANNKWRKRSTIGGLIMTRREGEQIIINHGELILELVEVKGKHARISFKANRDISIERAEKVRDDEKDKPVSR